MFQAVVDEPCSPPPIVEELLAIGNDDLPHESEPRVPSPARSTSSSSSGSYDLEDAMPEPAQQTAPLSRHGSELELDRDVSVDAFEFPIRFFLSEVIEYR